MSEKKENDNSTLEKDGYIPIKELVPFYQQPDFDEKFANLTNKEKYYFSIMRSQFGVLYIKAKPGVAKSAMSKLIAKKLGLKYIDLRLSMADETDMQFPNLVYRKEIDGHVIEHAIPEWAVIANQQPTLIHFEELNRAALAVRNAALQILLERTIGPKFSFNENVYMMASGNLGEDDGTDVEEFDNALNNRLIHVNHDLTTKEWLKWGGKDANGEYIIHPDIHSFIEFYGQNFYVPPNADSQTYATPRSWHMLSEFILKNYGGGPMVDKDGKVITHEDGRPIFFYDGYKTDNGRIDGNPLCVTVDAGSGADSKSKKGGLSIKTKDKFIRNYGEMDQYIDMVTIASRSFIGDKASVSFIKFLESRTRVSLKDILGNYPKVKPQLAEFSRDKYSEIITEAKKERIDKWSDREIDNFALFLQECSPDERVGFILYVIDHAQQTYSSGVGTKQVRSLLTKFKKDLERIKTVNKSNNDRNSR